MGRVSNIFSGELDQIAAQSWESDVCGGIGSGIGNHQSVINVKKRSGSGTIGLFGHHHPNHANKEDRSITV